MATELQERLAKVDSVNLTDRITLAVIDAAYKGQLDDALNTRIINYIHTPYAHSVGEPAYSLHDRFTKYTVQLHTKSGLLQMLKVVEMAGGIVDKTLYRCLAPKGIRYGHIKSSNDAMSILTQVATYSETLELQEYYESLKTVNHDYEEHLRSSDYAFEEHESYRKVRDY